MWIPIILPSNGKCGKEGRLVGLLVNWITMAQVGLMYRVRSFCIPRQWRSENLRESMLTGCAAGLPMRRQVVEPTGSRLPYSNCAWRLGEEPLAHATLSRYRRRYWVPAPVRLARPSNSCIHPSWRSIRHAITWLKKHPWANCSAGRKSLTLQTQSRRIGTSRWISWTVR